MKLAAIPAGVQVPPTEESSHCCSYTQRRGRETESSKAWPRAGASQEAIWRAQPDGSAITLENFPSLLHRWSKSRSGAGPDM
jgi:hypothetical protein